MRAFSASIAPGGANAWMRVAAAAVFLGVAASGTLWLQAAGQDSDILPLTDPIARLERRIALDEVRLEFSSPRGYLDSLLAHLDIPASSQTLVFSKTSFQADRIAPESPRAIYFNDDVYVGWVRGGPMIEIASVDPKYGTIFYSIGRDASAAPAFRREGTRCTACHLPARSDIPVPRLMVMSVLPNPAGAPLGTSVSLTTDESPMRQRWGGWYVTAAGRDGAHMGNWVIGNESGAHTGGREWNLTSLAGRFDITPYLTPHSDIVALSLLVHQSHVHNLIGEAGYAVREAIQAQHDIEQFWSHPDGAPSAKTMARVREVAEPLVGALLFAGAAPLETPIRGTSGFTEAFAADGPRDRHGRSLRDLDLETRLLRYPLSYLIYSESFDGLPELAKKYVYGRLWEIFSGTDASEEFGHLSSTDRAAVLAILKDTKPEFMESIADR